MPRYEYKVVPSPRTPKKTRGIRGDEARFAFTIEEAINASAAEGWEFMRSETLPCEHRGWFSRRTDTQTLLVFRRGRTEIAEEAPFVPSAVRAPADPRLPTEPRFAAEPRFVADRGAPRRASFPPLRAAPDDGEPR